MFIFTPIFHRSSLPDIKIIIITFPGIIIKEIIENVIYRYYNSSIHRQATAYTISQAILIVFFPFLINSIICALLTMPLTVAWQSHFATLNHWNFLDFFCTWVGCALGFHIIPTAEYINKIQKLTYIKESNAWSSISMKLVRFCTDPNLRNACSIGYAVLIIFLIGKYLI